MDGTSGYTLKFKKEVRLLKSSQLLSMSRLRNYFNGIKCLQELVRYWAKKLTPILKNEHLLEIWRQVQSGNIDNFVQVLTEPASPEAFKQVQFLYKYAH